MAAKHLVGFSIAVALIGAVIAVGALSALQADTPAEVESEFKPYHFLWFVGAYDLVTLIFTAWALHNNYTRLQGPALALLATVTAIVTQLISQYIYNTANFPGGNGSPTRGNIAIGGLITAVIGNFLIILTTAYYNLTTPPAK